MSFETLKATINSNIVSGLADGIRADYEHNPTLQDIVSAFGQDYIYMGSATVGTSPMTDDNARMYISSGSGEFTAFRDSGNNAIDISEGEIAILKGISGVYEKDVFFSGDTVIDAGSVKINDTGSLIQLQAKYNGSWITVSEFGYIGGDITLQDVVSTNINANSVVVNGDVESGYNTEVKDYLCIDGDVLVSQNEYLYADEFVEDRLESTTGEYIPNTASNSLAEIGMDTINDKCVLYNEAITYKDSVIESIVPDSTDGDFDVTRSSITNRVNRDGFIEEVPTNTASYNYDSGDTRPYLLTESASTNLITYPITFGDVYWTKSGATIEGDSTLTLTGTDVASGWDFTSGWTASGTATIDSATSFTLNAASDYVNKKYTTLTGDAVLLRIVGTKDGGTLDIRDRDGTSGSNYTITDNTFDVTFWMNYESSREPIMFHAADGNVGQVNITTMEFYEAQGFEAPKEKPSANSEELITNGDFATDSDWTLGADWTISGGTLNSTTAIGNNTRQDNVLEAGKTYEITYTITSVTSGAVRFLLGGSGSINGKVRNSIGTYTEIVTNNSTGSEDSFYLKADGSFIGNIDNVSVKEVTSYSGGGFERDAYKLVEDTSSGNHNISVQVGTADGNSNTASVYVKYANETKIIALSNGALSTELIKVDISNGTLFSEGSSVDDYEITSLANGWYRLSVTTTNATRKIIISQLTDGGLTNYQGDGTSGLYIAYAQLEESDYASSLMLPTTEGSTTSRVADAITNAGNSSLFSNVNSSGVLYAEIAANSNNLTSRTISVSNGTTDNRVNLNLTNSSNKVEMVVFVGGSLQTVIDYTVTDETEFQKVAVRYAENDFSLWIDGVERATDTSGITFPTNTLNECRFDRGVASQVFYGKTKAVAVFDYLSDDEMIRLTK